MLPHDYDIVYKNIIFSPLSRVKVSVHLIVAGVYENKELKHLPNCHQFRILSQGWKTS